MGWKQKSAQKLNFGETGDKDSRKVKVGDELTGRILDASETNLDGNPHNYTMETEGGLITFLGTASLDRLIKDEVGNLVKIKYLGDVKSGGGFMVKQFDVAVWDEDEPEAEAAKAKAGK